MLLERRGVRRAFVALPPLLLIALFIVTGFRGVDLGHHWDEVDWQLVPVQDMVRSGLLMPRAAIYPAFAKWLVLLPSLFQGLLAGLEVGLDPSVIQNAMLRTITAPDALLTARQVFIVVSSLTILWVYLAALVGGLPVYQATIAAAAIALSWEFSYHARWVATDCIVVQFTALTLLLVALFLRRRQLGYLYGAAVATGLAIGTKFPAVPLLSVVVVAGLIGPPPSGLPRTALHIRRMPAHIWRATLLGGTAFLAYLVSTPATLFEPFKFVELLRFISAHYAKGHWTFSVEPGFEHLWKVIQYFALSYFSPHRALSIPLFVITLVGGVAWLRSDRKLGGLLVGFPLVFLAFFCLRYSALIVRNYLLITPFLALLLARGAGAIVERLPHRFGRALAIGALASFGLVNATWIVSAAESIRRPQLEPYIEQALRYLDETKVKSGSYALSPRLAKFAKKHELPRGAHLEPERPTRVAFLARAEGPNPFTWPANDPFAVERVFGTREVNFDWYPTWEGRDRVVVMTYEKAMGIGLPFLKRQ